MAVEKPSGYVVTLDEQTGNWQVFWAENGQRREELTYMTRRKRRTLEDAMILVETDAVLRRGRPMPARFRFGRQKRRG